MARNVYDGHAPYMLENTMDRSGLSALALLLPIAIPMLVTRLKSWVSFRKALNTTPVRFPSAFSVLFPPSYFVVRVPESDALHPLHDGPLLSSLRPIVFITPYIPPFFFFVRRFLMTFSAFLYTVHNALFPNLRVFSSFVSCTSPPSLFFFSRSSSGKR